MKMNKLILYSLLFISFFSFGQKINYYKYGYEGVEMFAKRGDSTVVYSHKWAKATIRTEVADTIMKLYGENKIKAGKVIIVTKDAKVRGVLKIVRKPNLVSITLVYRRIEWSNGVIEEHI